MAELGERQSVVKKRSGSVLAVHKALTLLESLASEPDGLSLGELGRRHEMHPSTVHRLLQTLREAGYVRQDPSDRTYRLGSGALALARAAEEQGEVTRVAAAYLRRLADLAHESAALVILEEGHVIYTTRAEARSQVRSFTSVGSSAPAYCTAGGKALLAHLPPTRRRDVLERLDLKPYTSNTITDMEVLRVELERIRRRGYGVDDEEYEAGLRGLAAPVRDLTGEVVAAVEVSGPSARITVSRLTDLAREVQSCVADLSTALGFQG